MSDHVISILGLVAIFLLGTIRSVNLGALAVVAAVIIGTTVADESVDDIFSGFPVELFFILVGVTYLFGIARENGTVDWLVHASMNLVGGRKSFVPWVIFLIAAILTAIGASSPAAMAILAPISINIAIREGINPILAGLMALNGASAGSFSPIAVLGNIVNSNVRRSGLNDQPISLFIGTFVFNIILSVGAYFLFRGPAGSTRGLGKVTEPAPIRSHNSGGNSGISAPTPKLSAEKVITLLGILTLGVGAAAFDLDTGALALTTAVALAILFPRSGRAAVSQISWNVVLLVCGIITYIALLERMGTVKALGDGVANLGSPLLAALLLCYIGGVVSAFASTTGLLGALIPLAIPFIAMSNLNTTELVIAIALSTSVVDSSPFSTNGALVVTNAPNGKHDAFFRAIALWGAAMVVIAPILSWLIFVVLL